MLLLPLYGLAILTAVWLPINAFPWIVIYLYGLCTGRADSTPLGRRLLLVFAWSFACACLSIISAYGPARTLFIGWRARPTALRLCHEVCMTALAVVGVIAGLSPRRSDESGAPAWLIIVLLVATGVLAYGVAQFITPGAASTVESTF